MDIIDRMQILYWMDLVDKIVRRKKGVKISFLCKIKNYRFCLRYKKKASKYDIGKFIMM